MAEPVYWALLNLLMMLGSVLISILTLAFYFLGKKKEDEEDQKNAENAENTAQPTRAQAQNGAGQENKEEESEEELKRKGLFRILTIVPAAISVIAFFLTEDMRNPMTFTDKWTILMAILLIATAILTILSKKKRVEGDDQADQNGQNGQNAPSPTQG